jgi:hypothetical protein
MAQFILKRVVQNILSLTALAVLFVVVAGTPLVGGFWLYTITVIVYQVISLLFIVPKHPAYMELAARRQLKRAGLVALNLFHADVCCGGARPGAIAVGATDMAVCTSWDHALCPWEWPQSMGYAAQS